MELKEFDQEMWDAFAGCESDNPKWGEIETGYEDWIIIVDGNEVQAHQLAYPHGRENDVWTQTTWRKEFPGDEVGRAVAETFAQSLTPRQIHLLSAYGFTCINHENYVLKSDTKEAI